MTPTEIATWIGILLCISQSGMFSGFNLALFGSSRLRLEVQAAGGDLAAGELLDLRRDSNYLLSTILWGNVAVNCLLTLLSNSVLAGLGAFFFSTVVITFLGELAPQAYFSRHALKMVTLLSPLLRLYRIILYPVAKPSALLLHAWLGSEGINYYREKELHTFLQKHISASDETGIGRTEGIGALNFLTFDDLEIRKEGEQLAPKSILQLPSQNGRPVFPQFERSPSDPFIMATQASGMKWVILVDQENQPVMALDAEAFLRGTLFDGPTFNPYHYCHRPIVITNPKQHFGRVLPELRVHATHAEDDVIDHDIVLLWSKEKRIITGSDILGRLLRGIVRKTPASP